MLIGYMRVSSSDERQSVALQRDALLAAGVDERHLHQDRASGARDDRPGLKACLGELREGDVLVVWKIDRLGRSLSHLIPHSPSKSLILLSGSQYFRYKSWC